MQTSIASDGVQAPKSVLFEPSTPQGCSQQMKLQETAGKESSKLYSSEVKAHEESKLNLDYSDMAQLRFTQQQSEKTDLSSPNFA